jgi:sulfite reductase (NADPH) hemoprotein beta-component
MFLAFAKERTTGEPFGDFTIRKGYLKATSASSPFHADTGAGDPS